MQLGFTTKTMIALASATTLAGALTLAQAGGEHCKYDQRAKSESHENCPLDKNVTKDAKMTDNGAVVTLKGKNDEAVKVIKSHLEAHMKGESCPDCPLSMKGVTTKVDMATDGGTLTVTADSPDSIKAVQKWANGSASSCCMKGRASDKA